MDCMNCPLGRYGGHYLHVCIAASAGLSAGLTAAAAAAAVAVIGVVWWTFLECMLCI